MVVQDIKDINIPKPDKNGYCKAFKVIYSREMPHYTEYAKEYCNFFKDNCSLFNYTFVYQVGVNIAKHKEEFPKEPKKQDLIREGLHLILTLKDAQEWIKMGYQKVIEVFYKPEDVVAYGFLQGTKTQGVVVKQLTINTLKEVIPC